MAITPITLQRRLQLTCAVHVPRAIIRNMQVMLNGTPHRFDPPPATVAELVRALSLEGKRVAVEMNGEIVPKSRYAQTRVAAGDRLEVVAAVGGG
jgi:sulfur carrier protein